MSSVQVARFIISFSWLYHGIFPKLIHIAPLEKTMTASLGFSDEFSYLITKTAGIGEVVFGVIFFAMYKNKAINILNILMLSGLLIFVAILQPQILIEAFNPMTTNLALIGFSVILLNEFQGDKRTVNKRY